MLDAAQARADGLSASGGPLTEFAAIEEQLGSRLESLTRRRSGLTLRQDLLEECHGLEGAYKRLAELLFVRGMRTWTRARPIGRPRASSSAAR